MSLLRFIVRASFAPALTFWSGLYVELFPVSVFVDRYNVDIEFNPPADLTPEEDFIERELDWLNKDRLLLFLSIYSLSFSDFALINLYSVETQKYEITVSNTTSVKLSFAMS